MLPIVAATMRRRIEGCFGRTPACDVSAVMLGLPDVVQAQPGHLFIAGPRRGPSRQPPISGGRGQLHPFKGLSKDKSRAPRERARLLFTSERRIDFHSALPIAADGRSAV